MTTTDDKSRRVLYVEGSAQIGGANRSLLTLVQALDRRRYSPIVVSPQHGPMVEAVRQCGVPCHVIQRSTRFSKYQPWRLAAEVLRYALLILRKNVVLVHVNTLASWLAPSLAAALTRRPSICHLRCAVNADYMKWLARWSSAPTRVIANSEAMHEYMTEVLDSIGWGGRCRTIPNGTDAVRFCPASNRAPHDSGRPLRILFSSNLAPLKGPDVFLRIATRLKAAGVAAHFQIAGKDIATSGRYEQTLQRLAGELGVSDQVAFLGFRDDMPAVYRSADVLVWPARRFMGDGRLSGKGEESLGCPRVAIEAMACGVPVIASDLKGVREGVVDGETGILVPAEDECAFVEALKRVSRDREFLLRLAKGARNRATSVFSARRHAERVQKVYDELLK